MSNLVIRPALLSDAPAIGRIHCHAWRETYTGLTQGDGPLQERQMLLSALH